MAAEACGTILAWHRRTIPADRARCQVTQILLDLLIGMLHVDAQPGAFFSPLFLLHSSKQKQLFPLDFLLPFFSSRSFSKYLMFSKARTSRAEAIGAIMVLTHPPPMCLLGARIHSFPGAMNSQGRGWHRWTGQHYEMQVQQVHVSFSIP